MVANILTFVTGGIAEAVFETGESLKLYAAGQHSYHDSRVLCEWFQLSKAYY